MLTKAELQEIRNRVQPLALAEEKSKALQKEIPKANMFIGICNLGLTRNSVCIVDDFIVMRQVTNPPGSVHVCSASKMNNLDYLGVSRFSHNISAEILVGDSKKEIGTDFLLNIAWHIAALVKLRGHRSLFCPSAASESWDVISGASNQSVEFIMLDDISKKSSLDYEKSILRDEDVVWIRNYWLQALDLRSRTISLRFGAAFNISYTWNHVLDKRIQVSNLWYGLEALFGEKSDRRVKDMLATRISNWITTITTISEIKNLYERRCDAVHGRKLDGFDIDSIIERTSIILRESIIKCIEQESVPLGDW